MMPKTFSLPRHVAALVLLTLAVTTNAAAQTTRGDEPPYSDSDAPSASRTRTAATRATSDSPSDILRAARRVYVEPNRHIDAEYLEYKLAKLPEFTQWRLAIVKDKGKADLVVSINKKALNYIFQIVEPESSVVAVTGKVVAINGLVAAEDVSHEIVKKMRQVRALPDSQPE